MNNEIRSRARLAAASRAAFAAAALGLALPAALATGNHHRAGSIEARLRSFNEVPSVSSPATGRFKAWHDAASKTVRYELTYSGLEGTVTQAHIHFAQRSVNGGIMVWLCQTATNQNPGSPTCPQEGTVSGELNSTNVIGPAGQGIAAGEFDAFIGAIRAGSAYVNVHSSKFPAGEIRGQLRDD
jgi:hypothetical protein